MSLRTCIFNLKSQQPALINPWNSQQLSALYSAKLYSLFLKKSLSLLQKDLSRCAKVANLEDQTFIPNLLPKIKVMRSKSVSRRSNILIEIKSSTFTKERETLMNSKVQPMKSCLKKELPKDSVEKPVIFRCGNYSQVKELLVDDPMWSSGSLSICPVGKSPNGKMDSQINGRFLMFENASKSSLMSPDCARDLIMEHEKFANEKDETFSSNTSNKFKSLGGTTCHTYKDPFDIGTNAIGSVATSPWRHSPSSILNLAPYLL